MSCDLTNYTDFNKTLDVGAGDVANPHHLEVGLPVTGVTGVVDRLHIFTGTAVVNVGFSNDDEIVRRGVIRLNLDFPVTKQIRIIRAATTAGLGTISNNADESTLWAVDCVSTDPQPDPSDPTKQTLMITAALGIQGGQTALLRMAYEANVLVQNLPAELQSLLVDNTENSTPNFQPEAIVSSGRAWRGRLTLTGPSPTVSAVVVTTADPVAAPVQVSPPQTVTFDMAPGAVTFDFVAPNTQLFFGLGERDVTITATLGFVNKTARLRILPQPR